MKNSKTLSQYHRLQLKTLLVREHTPSSPKKQISSSADIFALVAPQIAQLDREHFLSILLNTKNYPIGIDTVSIGSLSASLVHPRELFRSAIIASASSIILAHNHPSGDLQPSPEDLVITERLIAVGDLLGITILDHIIIAGTRYFSMRDENVLFSANP